MDDYVEMKSILYDNSDVPDRVFFWTIIIDLKEYMGHLNKYLEIFFLWIFM